MEENSYNDGFTYEGANIALDSFSINGFQKTKEGIIKNEKCGKVLKSYLSKAG